MVDLALWGAALKKINNKTARFARACEEAQWIGWGAMELLYEPSGTDYRAYHCLKMEVVGNDF